MTTDVLSRNRKSPRALMIAVVLLVAALIAGCGGDGRLSKKEYIDKSNVIQADASKAISKVNPAGGDKAEGAKLVAEIDKAIAKTKALKPPTEWQKPHNKLVKAMTSMRNAMKAVVDAKPGDAKAITPQVAKISAAQADYNAALSEINSDR